MSSDFVLKMRKEMREERAKEMAEKATAAIVQNYGDTLKKLAEN